MHSQNIIYSQLTRDHVPPLVELLVSYGIDLIGLSDRHFLTHVMNGAANTGNPNVIVASTSSNEIIGWTIAIKNSRQYWRRFLRSHQFYALNILLTRCTGALRNLGTVSVSTGPLSQDPVDIWPNRSGIVWGQSSPQVARHIDITVLEYYQHLGVGQNLYLEQIKTLESDSVSRIETCIRGHNTPSQRFHIKQGWSLVKIEDGWVYVTKSICEDKS